MGNPSVDPDAFDAFEAAGWEERAVAYELFFCVITDRVVAPLLAAISVGVGARVLDVATGPGWVAARAAERGASVVGIDVAEAMIARARNAYPGLEFRRADAHELRVELVLRAVEPLLGLHEQHHLLVERAVLGAQPLQLAAGIGFAHARHMRRRRPRRARP